MAQNDKQTDDREKALDEALRSLLGHPLGYLAGYEAAAGRVRELFRELEAERAEAAQTGNDLADEIAKEWVPNHIPVAEVRKLLIEQWKRGRRAAGPIEDMSHAESSTDALLREHGWETDE